MNFHINRCYINKFSIGKNFTITFENKVIDEYGKYWYYKFHKKFVELWRTKRKDR